MSFIGGFIIASLIFALVLFKNTKNNNKKDLLLLKSIKKSTSSSELLKKITPFVNIDTNLDRIIYALEDDNFENLNYF